MTADAPPPHHLHDVPRQRRWWISVAAGALVLIAGLWLVVPRVVRLFTRPAPSAPVADASQPAAARRIQATLYYVTSDGTALVATSREVAYGATPSEQARRIVELQVEPPPQGLQSAIPAGTTVRSVFLAGDNKAYVDLGGTIVTGHTGGSLDEALTVYAIVDAITTNIPAVTAVQILVNGKQVDSLVGHLDLRYPLPPAPEWIRKGP